MKNFDLNHYDKKKQFVVKIKKIIYCFRRIFAATVSGPVNLIENPSLAHAVICSDTKICLNTGLAQLL